MEPSTYQKVIYKAYDETNDNIVVQACPGSGKTTTLIHLLRRTPQWRKVIFLAFNKSIQQELEKKVPTGVETSTIHSLGLKTLRKNVTIGSMKVSEYKTWVLAKKCLPYLNMFEDKKRNAYLGTISQLYDLYRLNLLKSINELEEVALNYGIDFVQDHIKDLPVVIKHISKYNKNRDSKEFMLDYTDMLYLPYTLVKTEDFPKYDVVMVDEVQDLNKLQKALIDRLCKPNGRFIAVGDKNQAIYAFIGANRGVFEQFEKAPRTQVLPLSVSYRCAKAIVRAANKVFGGMEPFENNEEGIVRTGKVSEAEDGDFIICRNNLPLIMVYFDLAKEGKKVSILGRDLQQGLEQILGVIKGYPNRQDAITYLTQDKLDSIKKKYPTHPNPKTHPSFRNLMEKINIVEYLYSSCDEDLDIVEKTIGNMFSDNQEGGISMMTGHKSKGLEADKVFFLFPELVPSPYAETPIELNQEECLKYVIVTRAKRELVFVQMSPVDQFRIKELGGVIKI